MVVAMRYNEHNDRLQFANRIHITTITCRVTTHRNLVATSCRRSSRSCFALCDQYIIGKAGIKAENDNCTASLARGC